jgi:hypothetical protein
MKRKLIIAIAAVLILLAAGVVLFLVYGTGSVAVQRWIAGQLGAVADGYLNPRLSLGALHYQYPLTAVVDDVRLVADDPAKPGATVDIFVARHVTLEMAEIPRSGRPLRIQKLILDHPEFRAVSANQEDSSLVGFSHFLKATPAVADTKAKLSDVFDIRLIQIANGLVVYDPRAPGARPMEIDQINCALSVEPAKEGETGWYTLEMELERKPVFATHFAGRVNIDSMVLDVQPLRVALKLGREQDHYLPPQIQSILKEHEVSGDLVVEASGLLHAGDWQASTLKAQVTLTGGNFAAGDNHFPLDRLQVLWTMADRRGVLEKFDAEMLGGKLDGSGQFALSDSMDGRVDLRFANLRIEQCLRNAAGGEGKYRGALSGQIAWQGPLTEASKQSRGSGSIQIVDGYLNQLPVLSTLLAAVNRTMKAAGMSSGRPSDTADMAFTFEGDRVNFHKVDVVTQMAVLRGHGDIFFDTHLNMLFNAGALEKVQSMLGRVGTFLGKMTDEISAYTLTGTLGEPQVGVTLAPNL